ncbi:MAG: hypothetical protein ACT4NV_17960 [Rhodoferax sp.]
MSPWLPSWVLVGALSLAWGALGFYAGDQHRNNAWLHEQASAQRAAKEALQAAQQRGDTLSRQLLAREGQIDQLKKEKAHAIALATTGRTCFSGPALRLLDQAPGLAISGLPAPASSSAAADGAAGADADDSERRSTDTQVAQWAADAAGQYEVCRARLNALIEWHAP